MKRVNLSLVDEFGRTLEAKPGLLQFYYHTGDLQCLVEKMGIDLPDLRVLAVPGESLSTGICFSTCVIRSTLRDVSIGTSSPALSYCRMGSGKYTSKSSRVFWSRLLIFLYMSKLSCDRFKTRTHALYYVLGADIFPRTHYNGGLSPNGNAPVQPLPRQGPLYADLAS